MQVPYKIHDYADPFSQDNSTRLIHLHENAKLSPMEKAALLSRYSRSTKSMVELLQTEFKDKNRGDEFITRILGEYGDDSVAELASEQIGIEGISMLAASKLTDRRVGISFLEKSTRYVPFTADSFYIPEAIYGYGLADEFKDLCGLSYNTFNFIFKDLLQLLEEKYPIYHCNFFDSKRQKEVPFEQLSLEDDIQSAEKAYKRAVKDKAYDNAGYSWLLSLKTNIGFNGNCRAIEYMLKNLNLSPLSELQDLSYHLTSLLNKSIKPFLTRVITHPLSNKNPFGIYSQENSIIGVYKHNIVSLLRSYDTFQHDLDEVDQPEKRASKANTNYNLNLIKNLLNEIGIQANGSKVEAKGVEMSKIHINAASFRPSAQFTFFMDEKFCINALSAAILYENNENLLDYDEQNINNIDQNLRIVGIDAQKLKHGILYELLNGQKTVEELSNPDIAVNKTTENTLNYNDLGAYFEQNSEIKDNNLYQDYQNTKKNTIDKEQNYLIQQYTRDRKDRRQHLGRATEVINYGIELSTSFRIMRDLKRHRQASFIFPNVITTRNSYDNYIIPDLILQNQHLFEEYRYLIEQSYKMYSKIVEKSNDYHTAQYANIMGVRTNYLMHTNLRELDHMLSIRSIAQGHHEYRQVSQQIYQLLLVLHPNIAKLLKFVDNQEYPLGRLNYEYKRERKLRN